MSRTSEKRPFDPQGQQSSERDHYTTGGASREVGWHMALHSRTVGRKKSGVGVDG